MIGGGQVRLPGNMPPARNGVLFLEELLEFRHDVIVVLR
jgi:predicted ATPase with chaperone activity